MSDLDNVFTQYPNIAAAPTLADLHALAKQKKVSLEAVKKDERLVKYKSIDRYGDISLIQNPAAWEYDEKTKSYIRPLPLKIGNIRKIAPTSSKSDIMW